MGTSKAAAARHEKNRQDCRDANHPISWHWDDGRPRRECGFCGDALDHSACATCQTVARVKARLAAKFARLTRTGEAIDRDYAAGRATKADILRHEDQLATVLRQLAALDD